MNARLARTADGWWLVTPAGLIRLGLTAPTTAALLADRPALDTAAETARLAAAANPHEAVPAGSLDLLSPVTAPTQDRGADGELPLPRDRLGHEPRYGPAGVLP